MHIPSMCVKLVLKVTVDTLGQGHAYSLLQRQLKAVYVYSIAYDADAFQPHVAAKQTTCLT